MKNLRYYIDLIEAPDTGVKSGFDIPIGTGTPGVPLTAPSLGKSGNQNGSSVGSSGGNSNDAPISGAASGGNAGGGATPNRVQPQGQNSVPTTTDGVGSKDSALSDMTGSLAQTYADQKNAKMVGQRGNELGNSRSNVYVGKNADFGGDGDQSDSTTFKRSTPASTQAKLPANVTKLAADNNISDPNQIKVGQKLALPGNKTYTIAAGDTLSAIAAGQFKGTPPASSTPVSGPAAPTSASTPVSGPTRAPTTPVSGPAAPVSSVSGPRRTPAAPVSGPAPAPAPVNPASSPAPDALGNTLSLTGGSSTPTSPAEIPPRPPQGGGKAGEAARIAWFRQYGATHNPDGSPKAKATESRDDRTLDLIRGIKL
jgi:LysM repeat protein